MIQYRVGSLSSKMARKEWPVNWIGTFARLMWLFAIEVVFFAELFLLSAP